MAGRRTALIVANDEYEHEGLKHLLAPAADAEALAAVLGDARIGAFDVRVARNEPAHVIQGRIEDLFAEARADDVLLLHFSCHGLKGESGELFFAARDTRPNRLASTATSADFVQRCMRASRSRSVVLLLDCCYGGAFSSGVTVRASDDVNVLASFPGGRLGGGRGRAVITASSAMEYAFEGDQLADDHSRRPSVFTSALVAGLATGEADRDQDGWVSLNELYDYVFDRVREQNPHQTPSRDVEMQGELYLARRANPVTVAAPLPAELQGVVDHPIAGVRAGAVTELARLAGGRHAGLALAARGALERLAVDDSRTVSAAATAALAENAGPGVGSARPGVGSTGPDVGSAGPGVGNAESGTGSRGSRVGSAASGVDGAETGVGSVGGGAGSPGSGVGSVGNRVGAAPTGAGRAGIGGGEPGPSPSPARRAGALLAGVWRSRNGRRWTLAAGAAAVVAAAAITVVLVLSQHDGTGGTPTAAQQFSAKAPWRLVIQDTAEGPDSGCRVRVAAVNGVLVVERSDVYTSVALQVRESGTFRWTANDPACKVYHVAGAGQATVPFVPASHGDTDAFAVHGPVVVEVLNFNGNGSCDFILHDAVEGRQVAAGSVPTGGSPVTLDPAGSTQAYLTSEECQVRIRNA